MKFLCPGCGSVFDQDAYPCSQCYSRLGPRDSKQTPFPRAAEGSVLGKRKQPEKTPPERKQPERAARAKVMSYAYPESEDEIQEEEPREKKERRPTKRLRTGITKQPAAAEIRLADLICWCSDLDLHSETNKLICEGLKTSRQRDAVKSLAWRSLGVSGRQNVAVAALTLVGKRHGAAVVEEAWLQSGEGFLFLLSSVKAAQATVPGAGALTLGDILPELDKAAFIEAQRVAGNRIWTADEESTEEAAREKNLEDFCHSEQLLAERLCSQPDFRRDWLKKIRPMTEVSFVFLDIVTLNSVCNECLRALNSRLCSRAFHDLLAGSLTDAGHATLAFEFFIRVTPVVAFQGISGQEYTKSLQAERSYTKGAGRSRWKKEKPIWSLMPSGRY